MNQLLIHSRFLLGLVLISALLLTGGCGTLIDGTRQEVRISSVPAGASVFINNQSFGDTPTVVRLKRSSAYTLILEMPGYAPYEIKLDHKIPARFWWRNIPLLGWGIDYVSGSLYELSPKDINKQFGTAAPPPAQPEIEPAAADSAKTGAVWDKTDDAYYVVVVMEPDPDWKKIGQLTPLEATE